MFRMKHVRKLDRVLRRLRPGSTVTLRLVFKKAESEVEQWIYSEWVQVVRGCISFHSSQCTLDYLPAQCMLFRPHNASGPIEYIFKRRRALSIFSKCVTDHTAAKAQTVLATLLISTSFDEPVAENGTPAPKECRSLICTAGRKMGCGSRPCK